VLDPLNPLAYSSVGVILNYVRRDREALEEFGRMATLNVHVGDVTALPGYSHLALGNLEAARAACATPPVDRFGETCLAIVYNKLHRQSEAEATLAAIVGALLDPLRQEPRFKEVVRKLNFPS